MNSIARQRGRSTESVVALAPWCLIAAALLPLAATRGWATYTVHHVLLFVAMVGLGWSGVLGSGWLARAAGVLSAAGFAALAVAEPLFVVSKSASFPFYGIGTLGVTVGLFLMGLAVLRARRWSGWHRFTPLLAGLVFAVLVIPSLALNRDLAYPIGLWGVCFLLMGISMREEV